MIKLQNILSEALNKKEIMGIVKKVYPHIAKDLGSKMVPVEVHNNIYKRLDAVGIEDLMKQNNPSAQYDWDKKKIYLYSSKMKNEEEIIKSLLHEHTHTLQNKDRYFWLYREKGYNYETHPFEKEAKRAEKKWKRYLKFI